MNVCNPVCVTHGVPGRRRNLRPAIGLAVWLCLAGCAAPERPVNRDAHTSAATPVTAAPAAQTKKTAGKPFPDTTDWVSLFDGKTLDGWKVSDFSGHGEVRVADGKLILGTGVMTGVTWT